MPARRELERDYAAALTGFVAEGSEAALRDAYEVGRRAVEQGFGVLDLLQAHVVAVSALSALDPELFRKASALLAESMSPFEMTHSGFREAHRVLKQSEARYRSLVDNAPLGIARCDLEGKFTSANPALIEMLGFDGEEDLLRALPDVEGVQFALERLLQSTAERPVVDAEWRRRDGVPIMVRVVGRPIIEGSDVGPALEIMCEDVTERYRLEQQLNQAQKMEAIARLAGGVAHDFNNFITGILLSSHILNRDLESDDPRRRQVENIEYAASRASLLTQQLLAFGRRQPTSLRVLDVNRVVEGLSKLLGPLLGADVELELRLSSDPCPVRGDPAQLEQVVMNLAINARDAMPEGGTIAVTVVSADVEAVTAERLRLERGHYVTICVRDTGLGMDEDTQSKVFEPFFTTKPSGKGTGLGLATCYGIVTQARGGIDLESAPGKGTTFTVYLPYVAQAAETTADRAPPDRSPNGSETVLLAEDDRTVRLAAEHTLREVGYTVLSAASGDEAIALAARRGTDPLDLILTDVVMPGAGGRDVARRVQELHPSAKVLYMSGYANDVTVDRGVKVGDVPFLQKPFTPETLLAKVRDVLDGVDVRE